MSWLSTEHHSTCWSWVWKWYGHRCSVQRPISCVWHHVQPDAFRQNTAHERKSMQSMTDTISV